MSQNQFTIFKLLSPIYYTTKILGVTPYSHDTNFKYKPTKPGIIRCFVLFLSAVFVFYKSLTNFKRMKNAKVPIAFTDYVHICFNILTLGCMMFKNCFKQKKVQFFSILHEILIKIPTVSDYKYTE